MSKFTPEQLSLLARIATGRSASYTQASPFKAAGLIKDGKDGWIDLTPAGEQLLTANGFVYDSRRGWIKSHTNRPTQKFLVPAFFIVQAGSQEEADEHTADVQSFALAKGLALYLDESLPTVAVGADLEREFHTVMDEPGIQAAARKALAADLEATA